MGKTIYFDMDGTIADLYSVENWEPMLRAENPTPYLLARPMMDIFKFNWCCYLLGQAGYKLGVISWLSMGSSKEYEEATTKAKLQWLEKNAPALLVGEKHFISYGVPKSDVAKDKNGILVDDNTEVGGAWQRRGGIWVNAKMAPMDEIMEQMAAG